jgi:beta-galactosidase/beta-glucuronidase
MKKVVVVIHLLLVGLLTIGGVQAQEERMVTPWAADVTPENVLPEYPRPQMVRERWLNLNGTWQYATARLFGSSSLNFENEILVPFPIESTLSGVKQPLNDQRLIYRRTFTIPDDWAGQRVLLHFGAVDWEAKVRVNGIEIGSHRGGYDAFSFDITAALRPTGEQELIVDTWDPTDAFTQPRGKQVRNPESIWYTPTSGIWQTVWLEPVPAAYISGMKMETDIDGGKLKLQVHLNDNPADSYTLKAEVLDDGAVVATDSRFANQGLEISIDAPKLWSPDSPFLYDLKITLLNDQTVLDAVTSYFGMRKIAVEAGEDGIPRLYLNNQPLFQYGLLDQGFWPDGLYTAPTDEALRYDIEITRELGFNMIRKHVKVEPARWYYWADRLGMLVWQDMPSGDAYVGDGDGEIERVDASAAQFELELRRMIDTHYNYPSIVIWVIFNEGWGQYETARISEWLEAYDPTRLVNSVSGWNDVGAGDVSDIHRYPGPEAPAVETERVAVLGEFGGLGLPLVGHTWLPENNWGYVQYNNPEALLTAYTDLINQLRGLVETQGLAAAVYTQTTDVEIEVNGMLTYDRAIIKMDVEQIRQINSTLYGAIEKRDDT